MLSNRTLTLIIAASAVATLYLLWKSSREKGPQVTPVRAVPPGPVEQ